MHAHGNACTRHARTPDNIRHDGRCAACRRAAGRKYAAKCRAELRQYRAVKALIAA